MKSKKTNGIRKKLAVFGAFCMLLMTCVGTLTVYAQDDAKLTASAATAEQGKTAAVTFTLEGNPGIWGLKFRVGYDHSALKLASVSNGIIFSDGDVTLPETLDKEQFVYLASGSKLEDISSNGTVVTLNFTVADNAQNQAYPITLEITQAINVQGDDIAMTAQNGSVTVKAGEPDNTPAPPSDHPPVDHPPVDNTPADNTPVIPPVDQSQQTVQSPVGQTGQTTAQPQQTEASKKKEAPRTGDDSSLAVWAAVTLVSGGAAAVLVLASRKRKGTKA